MFHMKRFRFNLSEMTGTLIYYDLTKKDFSNNNFVRDGIFDGYVSRETI